MNVTATCKFCRKSLNLTIDDDYGALGDPFRLIPLAACNHCADFRSKRRVVYQTMKKITWILIAGMVKRGTEEYEQSKDSIRQLCKRYLRLIADYRKLPIPDWDEAILESILSQPTKWQETLGRMNGMFAQQALL